ncbi:MAG: type IV secretion system DNA-binding domain-containing protein [Clostridia bacterium]|nr:type IV secretion system DNA-binding domain-containing protein [Clostridia bacterium]
MAQFSVLKGQPLSKEIPYRDPDALFALTGTDGNGKSAYLPVGQSMLERHVLLLGKPGSGKTGLMQQMARNLRVMLTEKDSLVILDLDGENYQRLHQKNDAVLAQDDRAGKNCWNLFEELRPGEDLLEDASALCESLFSRRIAQAADPFYELAARDLTMALIVYLARRGDQTLCNNQSLRELMEGFDVQTMRELLKAEPELKGYALYLADETDPRTLGMISAMQKAARELFQGRFGGKGTQSVRGLLEEKAGKVIFLCGGISPGSRDVAAALCGWAIRQCLNRKKKDGRVFLLLDDFCLLPPLPLLEEGMLLGRNAGLHLLLSSAGVKDAEDKYGPSAGSILGAAGTVAAFQLREERSRAFVRELYGTHRVLESCPSIANPRNMLEQTADIPVIGDEDLTALQPGEMIIATMHYPPFRFRVKASAK